MEGFLERVREIGGTIYFLLKWSKFLDYDNALLFIEVFIIIELKI